MPARPIYKPAGFLRLATIRHVDSDTLTARISFDPQSAGVSQLNIEALNRLPVVQLPLAYLSAGGGFIGGKVAEGTPVVVGQAEGSDQLFIVSFIATDPFSQSGPNRKII